MRTRTPPHNFYSYGPMQPPIILGLLWPNGSVLNQAFWQIYNQSYNAAVFFANKNKSSSVTQAEFIQSYVGSVATALALGVGAVKLGDILVHPVMRQSAGFAGWYEICPVTQGLKLLPTPPSTAAHTTLPHTTPPVWGLVGRHSR